MRWILVVWLGSFLFAAALVLHADYTARRRRKEERMLHKPADDLPHAHDECTGSWDLDRIGPRPMVRCRKCLHAHDATPENRLAAIQEREIAILLHRITHDGAEQLAKERDSWRTQ